MGYFTEAIEEKNSLKHHQILGAKHGVRNGPPYPLGKGDHSASEKSAAKAAGIKVGSDSGKGSIENVKKKKSSTRSKSAKKEMTEEEKRVAAVDAVRSGDRKKIAKYAKYLTSDELQDADNRVRNLSNITREESGKQKASKAEMEKQEVIRSGDKEKVREFADKMSYQELSEAMNRIDLNAKLFYEKPPKTVLDKISSAMDKVDKIRVASEKGIAAWNVAAKVYNSLNKSGNKLPEIKGAQQEQKSDKDNKKENKAKNELLNDFIEDNKSDERKAAEKRERKEAKKMEKEARKAEKEAKKQEPDENDETPKTTRDINEGMVKPIREASNQRMDDYDDFDYSSIFSESYMQSQRDTSFNKAMESFDYDDWKDSVRWSDF